MRPRVLFLDHAGVLGGAELSLLDLAAGIGGRVLLFEDGPFRERLDGAGIDVDVLQAPGRLLRVGAEGRVGEALAAGPAVLRLVRSVAAEARGADVIYANSQKAFVVGALAAALARRPLVWHLRDILTAEHFGANARRLVVTLANRFAACVVANSVATAAAFVDAGGSPASVRVVHNGISPAPFDRVTSADAQAARDGLGLGPGPVVGVFSRLAEWKGQHVLLEALPRLPGVTALLVGAPLFGEDRYADALRAQATRLGVSDRVVALGHRSDVPTLMAACDIVAHTSVTPEPFGRVVVEGMLAGRPVIAADAGGVREILTDGVTGRLVPPADPAALADAVLDLLARPEAAARRADAARLSAETRFSIGRMVAGVERLLADVARPSPRPRWRGISARRSRYAPGPSQGAGAS